MARGPGASALAVVLGLGLALGAACGSARGGQGVPAGDPPALQDGATPPAAPSARHAGLAAVANAQPAAQDGAAAPAESGDDDGAEARAGDGDPAGGATGDDADAADRSAPEPPWPEEAPPLFKGLWVGSWAPGAEGFDQSWVDEAGLRRVMTNDAAGRRRWAGTSAAAPVFPLDELVRDRQGPAVAYVYSLLARAPAGDDPRAEDAFPDQRAVLHVRHAGRVRVFWDGALVIDAPAPAGGGMAHARAPVLLTGPYDVVLLKCGRGSDELGPSMAFEVRVGDAEGRPLAGQGWNSMRPPGLPSDIDG